MLDIKDTCTGCGTCAIVCPKSAIDMQYDKEGFRYPIINRELCIECGKCEDNCSILNEICKSDNTIFMAAQNKKLDTRLNSSSGGVFSCIAEMIIRSGGAICAAKYDEDFSVIHKISENINDIPQYQGAKYSQSHSEQCFHSIKKILDEGRYVLFVGTPCQVAAVVLFLKKEYSNLILVDMICHGVPSPKVWKYYLNDRSRRDANAQKVESVNLRSKITGWSKYNYSVEITYKNGEKYIVKQNEDSFMKGFVSELYLRPSCSCCKFKGVERCSDFTLGDYWGIWNQYPEFDDNTGTSALLIHTEKGIKIWNRIQEDFLFRQVSAEEIIQYNPSLIRSAIPHTNRKKFFERLNETDSVIDWINKCLLNKEVKKVSLLKRILKSLLK